MTDLEQLEKAARAFVDRERGPGVLAFVKVHHDPDAGARVVFWRAGAIVKEARAEAPELKELARRVRERFGTSGSFELELAYVWTARYGPCDHYGGSASQLQELVRGELDKIARLPADWKPLTPEAIRRAMTED